MKEIETILEPITGYLVKITRNAVAGWYEMEVGIPNTWVFNENNEIGVEVVNETDMGKLLKIFPKSNGVGIDDLVLYVIVVINTNKKIAEKEEEFKRQLQEMKRGIEERASEYYKQMDELKENSFKKLSDNFLEGLGEVKKSRKPRTRKPKIVPTVTGTTG
jgi:uncharacterized protein with von Willebrand factor type A (vWA) domain